VVAGSLGSAQRLKYTAVGDVVVTAQRLESLGRVEHDFERRPCRILISERTRSHLDGSYCCEPLGLVSLKGKGEEVAVHRVVGRGGGQPESAPAPGVEGT
jgi:class 3 adenylate cyclase